MIGVFDEGVVVAATLAFISADPAALSSTSPIISFMSRKLTIDLPSASFHMIEMEPSPLTSVMMQAGISAEVCPPGHCRISISPPRLSRCRMVRRSEAIAFEQHFLCCGQCLRWHSAEQ